MANLSKTQTVSVNLAVVNNTIVVANKTLTTQQIGATTFLTGPTGPQGPKGDTGTAGATVTDASLLTTGTLSAARLPAFTGDITTSAGSSVTAISTGVIVNSDVNATANIDATKLGTGIVNNTEFNYLDGVTSPIQTQINGKAATTHTHVESDVTGLVSDLAGKQATLVSGTNIKTVNGVSLLGSGDYAIAGGTSGDNLYVTVGDSTTDFPVSSYADAGAAINTAYASLPSGGGSIFLQSGTYSYATPIVFGTSGKYVSFRGANASSTFLKFTPTSGNGMAINTGNPPAHLKSEISGFTLLGSSTILAAGATNTNTSIGILLGGANGAVGIKFSTLNINGFGTQTQWGANAYMLTWDACSFSGGNGVAGTTTGLQGSLVHIKTASNSGELNVFNMCTFTDPGNSIAANAIYMEQGAAASTFFENCSFDDAQLRVLGSNGIITVRNCHIENAAFGTYGQYVPLYFDSASSNMLVFDGNVIANDGNSSGTTFVTIVLHGVNLVARGNNLQNYGGQTVSKFFDHSLNNGTSAENISGTSVQGGGLTSIASFYPYSQQNGMGSGINYANSFTSITRVNSDGSVNITTGSNINTLILSALGDATINRDLTIGRNITVTNKVNTPQLQINTTSAPAVGNVWTATDTVGNGSWQALTGGGSGYSRVYSAIVSATTGATAASTDYTYSWSGSTAYTFTLPNATATGRNEYTIKNLSTIAQAVATTASQLIDTTTTIQIQPGDSVTVASTGTNWIVV